LIDVSGKHICRKRCLSTDRAKSLFDVAHAAKPGYQCRLLYGLRELHKCDMLSRSDQTLDRSIHVIWACGSRQYIKNEGAFAAVKQAGSVVTWGDRNTGGDSETVASKLQKGVTELCSTARAFAAIKIDGSVVVWGDSLWGGKSEKVASQLEDGVSKLCGTIGAFAAIKADGSVVTWGNPDCGGDSTQVACQLR